MGAGGIAVMQYPTHDSMLVTEEDSMQNNEIGFAYFEVALQLDGETSTTIEKLCSIPLIVFFEKTKQKHTTETMKE